MLSDEDVLALVHARHPDPFAVLGLHADADAPGALSLRGYCRSTSSNWSMAWRKRFWR